MANNKAYSNLLSAVTKMKEGNGFKDPNEGKFWKLSGDKAGNASAVIRFLPGKDDDTLPFTRVYAHGFQNDAGRWFIEECLTTLGKDCPVCAANSLLWNTGAEVNKEIVRKRKRKLSYIANVLVVEDKANPDNEGKIFLYKFGQKIFSKIEDKLAPEFEDEKSFNAFDLTSGADFRIKMRRVEGFPNFDKSEFKEPAECDMKASTVIQSLHDLSQFSDPKMFKSYEEIESKFNKIVNGPSTNAERQSHKDKVEDDTDDDFLRQATEKQEAKKERKVEKPSLDDDDSSDLEYFKKLAAED
jgi:hypothetical protein